MHEHDTEYCEFEEISTVVATWNAGATTPPSLRHEEKNNNFFREFIRTNDPPDIIVFGFQELVDLEDKKLTASSCHAIISVAWLTDDREPLQRQQQEGLIRA